MLKWKVDSNDTHKVTIGELNVVLHRWVHEKDKWFLSLRNGPFFFDRHPMLSMDIESAKREAIDLLVTKANDVQTALSIATKRDQKKIDSFKLRLVTILNEAENIQSKLFNEGKHHSVKYVDTLIETIKIAMSDL